MENLRYHLINYGWAQVMYSVWGGGQTGGSFQTPGIKEGMFVFGFFLDGSDEQVPIIMGVLGNNAKTTIKGINSKVGVDEVTDESSVFEPRVVLQMMAPQILQIITFMSPGK